MKRIAIIDRGRGPELAGTRVTVYDIIPYLQAGDHHTYIASVFGISSAQVLALMEYLEEHREEVMAEHRRIEERIARGNPPEVEAKRQASHAKLMALREQLRQQKQEADGASGPGRL